MKPSQITVAFCAQLHAELIALLRQHCPVAEERHLALLGWMVAGTDARAYYLSQSSWPRRRARGLVYESRSSQLPLAADTSQRRDSRDSQPLSLTVA